MIRVYFELFLKGPFKKRRDEKNSYAFSHLPLYLTLQNFSFLWIELVVRIGNMHKDFRYGLLVLLNCRSTFYFRYSAYFSSLALRNTIPIIPGPVWAPMAQPTCDSMIFLQWYFSVSISFTFVQVSGSLP